MIVTDVPNCYGDLQVAQKKEYTDERYPSNSKVESEKYS